VREFSAVSSNWRRTVTDEYMERYAVPVLAEIDTRALVRHLRTFGVMRGVISTKLKILRHLCSGLGTFAKWMGRTWRRCFDEGGVFVRCGRCAESVWDALLPSSFFQDEEARKRLHVVLMISESSITFKDVDARGCR